MNREYKTNPIWVKQVDEDQGIVEAVVAVFGNIDYQADIIMPGAFAKTITERGFKVRVLDNHQAMSGRDVIGKIVALQEVGSNALPSTMTAEHPEIEGGLLASVQFLMDTPEGAGIFKRVKSGAISEYSIGYDAVVAEPDVVQVAGQDITIRRLKELRLYEISPVIWAANPATRTVSAKGTDSTDAEGDPNKGDAEPSEGKPWDIFAEGGEFCVYQIDEDGKQVEKVSCHDSRDAAEAHVRALYANVPEDEDGKGGEPPTNKEYTEEGPTQRLSDVLNGSIHRAFTLLCDNWLIEGYLDRDERIQLSGLIGEALDVLTNGIPEEIAQRRVWAYAVMSANALILSETKTAGTEAEPDDAPLTPDEKGAEPDTLPLTSDVLADVEQSMLDLSVLELRALEVRDANVS